MIRSFDRHTLKLILTTVLVAAMAVNIAACNKGGTGEVLDTVSTDVEQSAGVCNIKVKFNNTFVSNAQIKFIDSNGTQVGEIRTISQTLKT